MPVVMNKLSSVILDEVSLVDRGANQHSKILLIKRADADDVSKAPAGIQFNVGFPEKGGSEIQSVVFDAKIWDEAKAKKWLADHDMTSEKVDATENTLRFRQKDPAEYKRFRMITPGAQISKALRSKDSLQHVMGIVDAAVRAKFEKTLPVSPTGAALASPRSYLYIRDFFEDEVIFEQDGKCYRCEYELMNDAGDERVTVGEKVLVDVVYQDVVAKAEEPPVPVVVTVSDELRSRVAKLRIQLTGFRDAIAKAQARVPAGSTHGGEFASAKGGGGTASGGGSDALKPKTLDFFKVGGKNYDAHGIKITTPAQQARLAMDLDQMQSKGFSNNPRMPKRFILNSKELGTVEIKHTGFDANGASRWSGNSEVARASGSMRDVLQRVLAP